jgi:opacity protein-like surface antigen
MTRFAVATMVLIITFISFANAQDSTPKVQIFGGYSLVHAGKGGLTGAAADSAMGAPSGTFGVASNFNGWNVEAQYNVTRWLGVVGDFGGRYGTPIVASSASGVSGLPSLTAYSLLFGPVLSYKTKARMTPFVHALFGWDRASLSGSALSGLPSSSAATTYTDFAMAFGGGLDYKLSRHLAVRVGQLDYLYTGHDLNSLYGSAFGPGRFQGLASHENNLRFSTGIVVRF